MKKGINAWCFPEGYSLEDIFSLAAECKFDAVELNMDEDANSPLALGMAEKDWDAISRLSERYQMPVSSVSTSLHWKYPLTDNDPDVRAKGAKIVIEMLNASAYLNCDTVLVVPGIVTEQVSYTTAYSRAQEAFKELRFHAESKKVAIGIENVWNKFLLSPMEMASFIDEIGSEYVKAYFDAGNVLQFSFPQHWVEALGKRIKKVHIKDFDTKIGNISGFKPLLQGMMPWPKLMSALKESGYDGYVTAELSPYHTNPAQLIRDTSAAMDYILSL